MTIKEIEKYVGKVADGKIKTSTYYKLQCQRHLNDLLHLKDNNWLFDYDEAQKHVNFLTQVARHTSDRWAGKLFQAQPFQCFMHASLFGWKAWNEDAQAHTRRFTTLLFDIARKNGKTEEAATLANDVFITSGYGTEIYCAATKREQAMKTFKSASAQMGFMMKYSSKIRRKVKRNKYTMEIPSQDSIFQPVSSDHNSLDGLNPLMAIIDEYHAHRTSDVLNVMETGQGARWDGPILMVTTTAGFDKSVPCYDFRQNAIEVLLGNKTDQRLLPFIFSMDPDDDWQNESNWYKSNPNLGVSVSLEWLKGQYQKAKNEGPSKQRQFQVKNLNMWVDAEVVWIERSTWKKNATLTGHQHYAKLQGKRCYGALDISSVRDLTSLALIFPPQTGLDQPHLIVYHFIPEKRALEMQRKGFPHMDWIRDGWLSSTSGNVIDYEAVQRTIIDCKQKYRLREIAFDRWGAQHVVEKLKKTGIEFIPHGQGFGDMNEPSKAFERDVYAEDVQIEHFNNPIMYWQIGNTVIKTDPAGNIKPDKEKATRQIDGVVATIMAWGLMKKGESNQSAYANRGVRVVG